MGGDGHDPNPGSLGDLSTKRVGSSDSIDIFGSSGELEIGVEKRCGPPVYALVISTCAIASASGGRGERQFSLVT